LQRAGNGGSPVRQADALPVPDLIATEIVENLEAALDQGQYEHCYNETQGGALYPFRMG
jgi:hypothetical protein